MTALIVIFVVVAIVVVVVAVVIVIIIVFVEVAVLVQFDLVVGLVVWPCLIVVVVFIVVAVVEVIVVGVVGVVVVVVIVVVVVRFGLECEGGARILATEFAIGLIFSSSKMRNHFLFLVLVLKNLILMKLCSSNISCDTSVRRLRGPACAKNMYQLYSSINYHRTTASNLLYPIFYES